MYYKIVHNQSIIDLFNSFMNKEEERSFLIIAKVG